MSAPDFRAEADALVALIDQRRWQEIRDAIEATLRAMWEAGHTAGVIEAERQVSEATDVVKAIRESLAAANTPILAPERCPCACHTAPEVWHPRDTKGCCPGALTR